MQNTQCNLCVCISTRSHFPSACTTKRKKQEKRREANKHEPKKIRRNGGRVSELAKDRNKWHTNSNEKRVKGKSAGRAGRQAKNCLIVRCCQEECLQLIAICFGNSDCIVFSFRFVLSRLSNAWHHFDSIIWLIFPVNRHTNGCYSSK